MPIRWIVVLSFVLLLPAVSNAQQRGQRGQRGQQPKPPSEPTPRYPDGHPMLSAPPGKLGYWDAGFGSLTGKNPPNLPTNLDTGLRHAEIRSNHRGSQDLHAALDRWMDDPMACGRRFSRVLLPG